MFKTLILFFAITNVVFAFDYKPCHNSFRNAKDETAFAVVAKHMEYTVEELCSLPRLLDVYITDRIFYRPENRNRPEPHTWVTLHYNEYSCQYFVRDVDLVITQSNCYNTF